MNTIEEYNGWINKPTWAAYMWLSNDYDSYHEIQQTARDVLREADTPGEAIDELADILKRTGWNTLPEDAGLNTDLLHWAMSYVDYHAVATAFLDEVKHEI